MKITKFGHCCMLIEEKGVKVLTDPGVFTQVQNDLQGIDIVLITHEHQDHFHIESVKKILENNPNILIVTNSAVNKLLEAQGISDAQIVEDTTLFEYKELSFLGCGSKHEEIYKERGQVMNTGYFIGEKFYYGGDSFFVPPVKVEILALPVGGGWLCIRDAINFAINVKPRTVFPVHDIMYNKIGLDMTERHPSVVLPENGIDFLSLELGKEYEF